MRFTVFWPERVLIPILPGKRGHCMSFKQFVSKTVHGLRVGLVAVTVFQFALGGPLASPLQAQQQGKTSTPIKHVIVLIGENRTFDNLFATYVSPSGEHVSNLLSEGIINADGTPGEQFSKAAQFQAVPPFRTKFYVSLNPNEKAPYDTLPAPTLNFSPSPNTTIVGFATEPPPFPAGTPTDFLKAIEPSLEVADLGLLTTGASGQ